MKLLFISVFFCFFLVTIQAQDDDLVINIDLNFTPNSFNPVISRDLVYTDILQNNIFMGLMVQDIHSFELKPALSKGAPLLQLSKKGTMSLTYELREGATWDNGTPILATDVAFTLKANLCPSINNEGSRNRLHFVESIELDNKNPRKITIHCNKQYILAEHILGLLAILPAYHYDKQEALPKLTISKLRKFQKNNQLPTELAGFVADFNSNYNRLAASVSGSGPYAMWDYQPHVAIQLVRKKNWWGDKFSQLPHFAAHPQKLNFIITEGYMTESLRMGKVDISTYLHEEEFLKVKAGKDNNSKPLQVKSLPSFSYRYIGLNQQKPLLQDVKVRKALTYLIDVDTIIHTFSNQLADRVLGPISPLKKYYNAALKAFPFDLEMAKKLLADAGWQDSNQDGILDKKIDGELQSLSLEISYPLGHKFYSQVAHSFQANAKEVGVEIQLMPNEFSIFLSDLRKGAFDMYLMGWAQTSIPDDLTLVWHSDASNPASSNLVGFGNAKTDQVIESIRITMDTEKRAALYKEIQTLIYNNHPYIFLCSPQQLLIHNSKIKGDCLSSLRPFFHPRFCEE